MHDRKQRKFREIISYKHPFMARKIGTQIIIFFFRVIEVGTNRAFIKVFHLNNKMHVISILKYHIQGIPKVVAQPQTLVARAHSLSNKPKLLGPFRLVLL